AIERRGRRSTAGKPPAIAGPGGSGPSRRAGTDDELARPDEAVGPLEPGQLRLDLAPHVVLLRGRELREHLVKRTERLALELRALGRRREAQRRLHAMHLDAGEPRALEQLVEVRRRERPGQARRRRRQLG